MEKTNTRPSVEPAYTRIPEMNVDMYTNGEVPDYKLLRGRALLNRTKSELTFVQNTPRGPRSVEIGRTVHARFVRRPDGDYTITFRVAALEKHLREQMIAEVRDIVTAVIVDYHKQECKL